MLQLLHPIATTNTDEPRIKPKILLDTWHTNNTKNNKQVKAMLPNSYQQHTAPPKVKATLEKDKETLGLLGMDFSEFDK